MVKQLLTLCLLFGSLSVAADDWMSRLEDTTLLSRVALPGAHDAGTGDDFIPSQADWSAPGQTQGCSLAELFHRGVRAYDLRPAAISGAAGVDLLIFHGRRQTNANLSSALYMFIDSLKAHPTEFVVVVLNHESEADGDSPLWAEAIGSLLNSEEISPYLADYSPALTVGDLRGKLLILSRQHYSGTLRGGLIYNWGFSDKLQEQTTARIRGKDSEGALYVQDFYDTTAEKMEAKLLSIEGMIREAQNLATVSTPPLIINHTSGYSAIVEGGKSSGASTEAYIKNAAQTNAKTIAFLQSAPLARGIIVMDYAGIDSFKEQEVYGAQLTRAVIEQNFR